MVFYSDVENKQTKILVNFADDNLSIAHKHKL